MSKENIKAAIILKILVKFKKQISVLLFFSLVSSSFLLVMPYLSKSFIDKAFIKKDLLKFIELCFISATIFILSTLFTLISNIVKNKISLKLKLSLADKFIKRFYNLDLNFVQPLSSGEISYRLGDIESITGFIVEQCPKVLSDIVKIVVILTIAFLLNAQMTLFLLILSPLFLFQAFFIQARLSGLYEKIWQLNAKLCKEVYDSFSKFLIIKALNLEMHKRHAYLKALILSMRWRIKIFRWEIGSFVIGSFLSKAVYGALTFYGGWLIIKGNLSLGTYTAVMIYLAQLGSLLEESVHRTKYLAQETVSLQKFFEIIESRPRIQEAQEAKGLKKINSGIFLKDIHFGYDPKRPLFKGLNLSIPSPSWVAIVGPSGCGKTTLLNLMLRLHEPLGGNILFDELELKSIKLKSLRANVSIAPQEPLLFNLSIKDNICCGLNRVSRQELDEACRTSCLYEFISGLPEGYDTQIGEDAFRLSQGLKQRVALARAILRDPQILIIDEATSSIDSPTEEMIFKSLRRKRKDKITIIVTHRIFSIKDADKLYFLNAEGNIEEGLHESLLMQNSGYRNLFQSQLIGSRVG